MLNEPCLLLHSTGSSITQLSLLNVTSPPAVETNGKTVCFSFVRAGLSKQEMAETSPRTLVALFKQNQSGK